MSTRYANQCQAGIPACLECNPQLVGQTPQIGATWYLGGWIHRPCSEHVAPVVPDPVPREPPAETWRIIDGEPYRILPGVPPGWPNIAPPIPCLASADRIRSLEARVAELEKLLRESRRLHVGIDSRCAYTYPSGLHCSCGASKWNARVDATLGGGK